MRKSRNGSTGSLSKALLKLHSAASLLLLFISIFFLSGSVSWAEQAENEGWKDHFPFDISGEYRADYWGRWNTDDGNDQDLYQYLRLKFENIVPNKVSVYFSGRVSAELNGGQDSDDFFADIYDTFDSNLNGRIYYLYVDIKDPVFKDSDLRVGRQYSYEGKTIFFTGAKYDQTIEKLHFYLQGGFRASNYTGPSDEDTIGGLGLDYHILPYTYVGYDYLRAVDGPLDDDFHSFDISQRFGSLKTYAQISILNRDVDELNVYGSYYHAPWDVNLNARYYALLSRRTKLTNEFSALVNLDGFNVDSSRTLGVYSPFNLLNLSAYKGWGEKFAVTGGYETRWMDENDERNTFNREYDRYFFTVDVWNCLMQGLTTSFTFEYWNVNGSEDSISFGVDAEKDINDRLKASAGVYFSRYRIHTTFTETGEFSDNIETPSAYGKLKYKLRENVALIAKYAIEHEDDLGTTHELCLSCSIDF